MAPLGQITVMRSAPPTPAPTWTEMLDGIGAVLQALPSVGTVAGENLGVANGALKGNTAPPSGGTVVGENPAT